MASIVLALAGSRSIPFLCIMNPKYISRKYTKRTFQRNYPMFITSWEAFLLVIYIITDFFEICNNIIYVISCNIFGKIASMGRW